MRQLPDRYQGYASLLERLQVAIEPYLRPKQRILDVGAGKTPTLPRDRRHRESWYVGLDVAAEELAAAGSRSYDATIVGDIAAHDFSDELPFDLAISCHVVEHFSDTARAMNHLRQALAPEGRLVMLFSSRYSVHSIANRIVPEAIGKRLIDRPPETKFPAHYDHCSASEMREALAGWDDVKVEPLFLGANYFARWGWLQGAFLEYENWAARGSRANLASHLLVQGTAREWP